MNADFHFSTLCDEKVIHYIIISNNTQKTFLALISMRRKMGMNDYHPDYWEELEQNVEEKLQLPPMFKVLLHNDDYTTMEFVVEVLQQVFHKSAAEATRIMLLVHKTGSGVCGSLAKMWLKPKWKSCVIWLRKAAFR